MYDKVWKHDKIAFGGDYNPEQWDEATRRHGRRICVCFGSRTLIP